MRLSALVSLSVCSVWTLAIAAPAPALHPAWCGGVGTVLQSAEQPQDPQEGGAEEDPEDEKVREALAKLDKLVADGKLPKAITEVKKLYKSTGHLRAGYALSQLLKTRAEVLAETNRKKAHPVVVEGGKLARELLANPEFPAAIREEVREAIYRQACSEAALNEADEAVQSLQDLFGLGFEDFERIMNEPDFAKLADNEAFQKVFAERQKAAAEKLLGQAREEIAAFESFAFDFNTTDLAGRPLTLEGLQGKLVVVDFWGTWCPPCRAEIPAFVRLKQKYASDLEIVGLAYERGEGEEAAKGVIKFGTENGINYPCALGDEETRDLVPEFRGYPTTLFIDRSGKVRMVTVGAESYNRLESILLALMEEQTSADNDGSGE